jgi:hypothetical protein
MVTHGLIAIADPAVSNVASITASPFVRKIPNVQLNALIAETTIQQTTVDVWCSKI